jgi:hypothetical protein
VEDVRAQQIKKSTLRQARTKIRPPFRVNESWAMKKRVYDPRGFSET